MVQILRGADCGQDLGDATGDVEARLRVERKKELRLGPRGVRHRFGLEGGEERKGEKTWTRAKSGQSLGSSWPSRGKRVNECLGDLPRAKYSWKRRDSSAETFETHVGSGIGLG